MDESEPSLSDDTRQATGDSWRSEGNPIRAWFADHRQVASEAALFVSQRLMSSLLVWLMVGVALTLPGLLWIAGVNVQTLSERWQGDAGLTVYMKLAASEQTLEEVAGQLEAEAGVERILLTTPDQALQKFLAESEDSDLLREAIASVETNPLPASFAVIIEADSSYLALDTLSRKLSSLASVDEVVIESTWLERLANLSDLANRVGGGLSVILLIAALLVAFASVRLAIESRLGELRVLALVGATQAQLRRPFLYFGSAYGLGGGIMAITMIALFLSQIEAPLQSLLTSYGTQVQIVGFTPLFLVVILLAGWALGVAGATLAMNRRLSSDLTTS